MTVSTDTPRVPLTATEAKVAQCAARGLCYATIGVVLGMETRTVETHVRNIAAKLPNDDDLTPRMVVTLWAAHQLWLDGQRKTA